MNASHGRTTLYARLAADLRARRPEAIEELLEGFGREIQGVAYLILRNHADAEEIVMDTLVTAWRKGHTLRDDTALRSWLLTIASRHALSRRRWRRDWQPLFDAEQLTAPSIDGPSAERVAVAQAIDALPVQVRAAIALHHVAGLTVAETAAALGKSENTVKSQVRDGLARLRASLDVPARRAGGDEADVERA